MRRIACLLLLLACEDPPLPADCGPLPSASGCPLAGGGSCKDDSCSAIYSCRGGTWVEVETCAAAGAAGAAGAGSGGSSAASGQGGAGAAGGPCATKPAPSGCASLQAGDCDAALLDACLEAVCEIGCDGFLRCEGGEWSDQYVAYCTDEGELITLP